MKLGIKVALLALAFVAVASVAAAVVYTLQVNNTMRLGVSYSLAFRRWDGTTPITAYAWGDFNESQEKRMFEADAGSGKLYNLGNNGCEVTWISNCPSTWVLRLEWRTATTSFATWNSGETHPIAKSDFIFVNVFLKEDLAVAGTDYSFALTFQIIT